MSDVVIHAENLGKKYTIGHQTQQRDYTALRDVLVDNARGIWNKTRDLVQGKPVLYGDTHEEFWALQGINFAVRQGDAVGLIGRNGAGKSTLLKILSRITEPSVGRVTIKGRVASLLEVGTGFHPELSGRENIYLNGAILGMTRREIKRKFDEIVAFAEVDKYLDTPVKRYSSGMYVRLAFAVAAHLEPEILVVDEVLAVGDAEFQKRCLGKMEDVASEGRTVLFVSHNMGAIATLCDRAILLKQGQIEKVGMTDDVIDYYQQNVAGKEGTALSERLDRRGEGEVRFTQVEFFDAEGKAVSTAISGQPLTIALDYEAERDFTYLDFAVGFRTPAGSPLILCRASHHVGAFNIPQGSGKVFCHIDDLPLADGNYYLNVSVQQNKVIFDWIERAALINVITLDFYRNGSTPDKGHSPILLRTEWNVAPTAQRSSDTQPIEQFSRPTIA
ncbi:MAG: ABC transporter ATP-binding protein [Caldilineaceae bacterium]|nr:ABC transporter ATP-binding protein [Caldilineaceae bacterium]